MAHSMNLVGNHEGTEEWHCSNCERRVLIEWSPWQKVVLESGDENIRHVGNVDNPLIGEIQLNLSDD